MELKFKNKAGVTIAEMHDSGKFEQLVEMKKVNKEKQVKEEAVPDAEENENIVVYAKELK